MIRPEIKVKFIGTGTEISEESWSSKGLEYVEDLVYAVLNKRVGPVYRILFGLRSADEPDLWYAPNTRLIDLYETNDNQAKIPTLELRMRYRPSCFKKLAALDPSAFEIIFAQIRYDFVHTKFSQEKRDFLLLNESVLVLITTDVLRYAKENNINENEIFERIRHKEFIPHRAPKWQRSQLFKWPKKLSLQTTVYNGIRDLDIDIVRIKRTYLETFLLEACPDYGMETYRVDCGDDLVDKQIIEIRLRYSQTAEDLSCVIEYRSLKHRNTKLPADWTELCDIYSLGYGLLKDGVVEINRSNGRPFRVKFNDVRYAKSFLSLIDGYYRLMRKWNFNFCADVSSPFLQRLKQIKCHGPIGYQTAREKLSRLEKPGTFLVRQCMEKNDHYLIDAWLGTGLSLIIDIEWDPCHRVYRKLEHLVNKDIAVNIILGNSEYKTLKAMIDDTQIWVQEKSRADASLKLKYWLPPSDYDNYPALLLSMSKKNLKTACESSIWQIERGRVKFGLEIGRGSSGIVIKGVLSQWEGLSEQVVAVKCIKSSASVDSDQAEDLKREFEILKNLKHQNIVQTLGFINDDCLMVVMEYMPLGSLLSYLKSSPHGCVLSLPLKKYALDISRGMEYLEGMKIVHRDLALRNVLLKSQDEVKICDFGLAQYVGSNGNYTLKTDRALPLRWFAPESLETWTFSHKSDVWSYGVVLWEMYSGGSNPQYSGSYATLSETLKYERLLMPKDCPTAMYNLMLSCWAYHPDDRENFSQICALIECLFD